ncbi:MULTISPECIES: FUSC family protein [unclassified Bradyrhizobium]|uniref:FUSC family protein n=1 Tax=unclassified Bradyrhizobium TaxID=2631580 RepID=UPI001BA50E16|nr:MULTISPECIES: FUSC family protein [unclassified Bradyrhizobium]MBR1223716.1 FUSC family protein [Bradyrhizobium sp. AUGA SZCCT0176]MBR1296322.1 FUSC family protein [Bradyrhizobium sp. AUGA SZCCT0042]
MAGFLKRVAGRLRSRRTQLALAVRVTVAAVVAYTIANALHLTLPLWAVLTSLIVTQMSVGRSLKATTDYMLGTIGGAIYGGALAVLIPHSSEAALLALLVLTVAPLAYLGSINPSLTAATVTGVIVLLIPEMHHTSPLDSVIDRLIEVTVGASTGLAASFLVLPSRAHRQIRANAARLIELIAGAFSQLLVGLTHGLDNDAAHRIQDGIGAAVTALHAMGQEAERERAARLSSGPDTGPLLRTILRLRHDVVMIGRECLVALPANVQARLDTPLSGVREAIDAHLRASAAALRSGASPPVIDPVQFALQGYAEEVASVRRDGLIRGLPGDAAERFFALGFSLEQMRQNIGDLDRCVAEWSEKSPVKATGIES